MLKINEQSVINDLRILRDNLNTSSLEECVKILQLIINYIEFLNEKRVDTDTDQEWNNFCRLKYKLGNFFVDLIRSYNERVSLIITDKYSALEDTYNEEMDGDNGEDNVNNDNMNRSSDNIDNIYSLEKIVLNFPSELISLTQNIFISEWIVKEIFKNEKKLYLFSDILIFVDIINKNGENKYSYEFEKHIDILDYDVERTTISNSKTIQFVEIERNKSSNLNNNQLIHNSHSHSRLIFEKDTYSITKTLFYFESEEECNDFIRQYKELRNILLNCNVINNNSDIINISQIDVNNSLNFQSTATTDNIKNNASLDFKDIDADIEHLNSALSNLEFKYFETYPSTSNINNANNIQSDDKNEYGNVNDILENYYLCAKEFKAKGDLQIDINLDDIVTINLFTGKYILGKNCNTNREGLFPIYYIERLNGKPLFYRCKEEMEFASVNDEIFLMRKTSLSQIYSGYNITKGKQASFDINYLEPIIMDEETRNKYEALYTEESGKDSNSILLQNSDQKRDSTQSLTNVSFDDSRKSRSPSRSHSRHHHHTHAKDSKTRSRSRSKSRRRSKIPNMLQTSSSVDNNNISNNIRELHKINKKIYNVIDTIVVNKCQINRLWKRLNLFLIEFEKKYTNNNNDSIALANQYFTDIKNLFLKISSHIENYVEYGPFRKLTSSQELEDSIYIFNIELIYYSFKLGLLNLNFLNKSVQEIEDKNDREEDNKYFNNILDSAIKSNDLASFLGKVAEPEMIIEAISTLEDIINEESINPEEFSDVLKNEMGNRKIAFSQKNSQKIISIIRNYKKPLMKRKEFVNIDNIVSICEYLKKMAQGLSVQLNNWHVAMWDIEIWDILYHGPFSIIYKAFWLGLDVAIKEMSYKINRDPVRKEFTKDVKMWYRLKHPNVLSLYGAYQLYDYPFVITPLMKNGNLIDYIRNKKNISLIYLIDIIIGISSGMEYLHSMDVVHGDLMARNILLDENLQPHICDFCFSKRRAIVNHPSKSKRFDSLRWTANEVHQTFIYTKKSDVYSFAMLCYELFTWGKVPFENLSERSVSEAVIAGERPDYPEGFPKAIWKLMEKMWDENPEARPKFANITKYLRKYKEKLNQKINQRKELHSEVKTSENANEPVNNDEKSEKPHDSGIDNDNDNNPNADTSFKNHEIVSTALSPSLVSPIIYPLSLNRSPHHLANTNDVSFSGSLDLNLSISPSMAHASHLLEKSAMSEEEFENNENNNSSMYQVDESVLKIALANYPNDENIIFTSNYQKRDSIQSLTNLSIDDLRKSRSLSPTRSRSYSRSRSRSYSRSRIPTHDDDSKAPPSHSQSHSKSKNRSKPPLMEKESVEGTHIALIDPHRHSLTLEETATMAAANKYITPPASIPHSPNISDDHALKEEVENEYNQSNQSIHLIQSMKLEDEQQTTAIITPSNLLPDMSATDLSPDKSSTNVLSNTLATDLSPDKSSTDLSPDKSSTDALPDKSSTDLSPDKPSTDALPDKLSTNLSPDNSSTNLSPVKSSTDLSPDKSATTVPLEISTTNLTPEKSATDLSPVKASTKIPPISDRTEGVYKFNFKKDTSFSFMDIEDDINSDSTDEDCLSKLTFPDIKPEDVENYTFTTSFIKQVCMENPIEPRKKIDFVREMLLKIYIKEFKERFGEFKFDKIIKNNRIEFNTYGYSDWSYKRSVYKVLIDIIKYTHIKYLYIRNCSFSDPAIVALVNALAKNNEFKLVDITFISKHSRPQQENNIMDILNYDASNLDSSWIINNKVTIISGQLFANLIYQSPHLKAIHLRNAAFGNDCAQIMANALINNSNIEEFELRNCMVTDIGASAFAEMLNHNHTLLRLTLQQNAIGDKGANALTLALRNNKTLKCLSLQQCGITAESVSGFTPILLNNTTLEVIKFSSNKIGNDGAIALADGIIGNSNIKQLWIDDCNVSKKGIKAISKALDQNQVTEVHVGYVFNFWEKKPNFNSRIIIHKDLFN